MKELYILCYDYCDDGNVCPAFGETAQALLQYFSTLPHKAICSPEVLSQLQPYASSVETSTYLQPDSCHIPSFFEQEMLFPDPFVVLFMPKSNVQALFSYIDPYVLKRQWEKTGDLELFHITCESDHIGTEWIWQGVDALVCS
ncbi:hypothetical protein [Ectobacillus ponti]|uniref:Uncharacterized protein n=1 Tax=Ectobacillus ponti TaxID=2961894 RepID=A0AA42BSK9_9BACI|nr:hypothetical protein [Ectobacillus ponti]MCP8968548.1 hypothetical protein [Ectobacillus ponti]